MHSCGSHVRTMNDSVAAVAPVVPPDTGASTMAGDATEQPGTGVAARRSCAFATSAATCTPAAGHYQVVCHYGIWS